MIEDDVLDLIGRVRPLSKTPGQIVPASEEELGRFELAHGLILPEELKSWFRRCNGASVNPGGLYSLFPAEQMGSLDWHLKAFPDWKRQGWFPVTDDGCGDLYIFTTQITIPSTGTHPVCFLDQSDFGKLNYAVASGLWRFLYFLLQNEILHEQGMYEYWPFDKAAVLRADPDLAKCSGVPLPWEVNE